MGSIIVLALKQLGSSRGLAAVLSLGIVVAGTLLAAAPIYARSMADLGLTYTIRTELEDRSTSRVEFAGVPLNSAEGQALQETVERRIDERLGWFTADIERGVRLGRFSMRREGDSPRRAPPQGEPAGFEGWRDHVTLVSGAFPERRSDTVIEAALSQAAARAAGVAVGDMVVMTQEFDNCERELPPEGIPPPPPPCPITERVEFTFSVLITGIVEPIDVQDPFWPGTTSRYFVPYFLPIEGVGPTVVLLTERDALVEDFGSRFPNYRGYSTWSVRAEAERLTRTNFERARDDLIGLYDELEPYGAFAVSPLRDTLIRYGRSADYQQVPLLVLLLEITGIALFYIGVVATVLIERQSSEIGLLRGRGASIWQILSMYLVQGLVLGLPVLLFAPFLAGGTTALLGLTPVFSDVTGGEMLPVTIVPSAFGAAAAGIALSMAAILLPAYVAARRSVGSLRRGLSRPEASFFQRYYLDIALAGAAALLLIELRQRGSVFTPSATGGVSSDPLLLASPALALLAAGALILRFYPLVLRLVAWSTRVVSGPSAALALVQVVRNAGQYTRLTLLLMMAVAVGTFAASYTATADQSYRDRANHEAGVDVRAFTRSNSQLAGTDPSGFEVLAEELPGVTRATTVVRVEGGVAAPGTTFNQFQVLGIDPAAAKEMLAFRSDLADRPMDRLMQAIESTNTNSGYQLPSGAESISVFARTDTGLSGLTLRAGIVNGEGAYTLVELGDLDLLDTEWQEVRGELTLTSILPVEPLTLVSLVVTGASARAGGPSLFLDDVMATGADGRVVLIEDFDGPAAWSRFPSVAPVQDNFELSPDNPRSGAASARLQIRANIQDEVRGIYLSGFLTPLPVIAGESFLAATGGSAGSVVLLRVGGVLVPTVIRATFDLFPTTLASEGPVVVYNRDRLLYWLDVGDPGFSLGTEPSEIWLSVSEDADLEMLEQTLNAAPFRLEQFVSRQQALEAATKNPLIAASGSGILLAAFAAVMGLVAAALLTSLLAAVRRRRVEFAVVQAIGLTKRQLLGMLALEYTVVFVMGIGAGALMGLFVSDQMLSFLDVTESGERIEPPFILQTRWLIVSLGVGLVAAVFTVALWLASHSVGRGTEAAALRTD